MHPVTNPKNAGTVLRHQIKEMATITTASASKIHFLPPDLRLGIGIMDEVGDGGTKSMVSNPQCGHGIVRVSPLSKALASNSMPLSQC